jgi:hypothetical protein
MRELRFHRSIYAGEAIDAALQRFEGFATFEREIDGEHFVVRVNGAADERRLAGELANFALGLTVEQGGPTALVGREDR